MIHILCELDASTGRQQYVCVWGEWNNITTATESEFIMENSLLYRNGTERTKNRVENKQNRPRRTSEQQPKTRKSRFSAF